MIPAPQGMFTLGIPEVLAEYRQLLECQAGIQACMPHEI